MNFEERKNITFRLITDFLLLFPLGIIIFSLVHVFQTLADGYILSIIALMLTAGFLVLEFAVVLKGWRKESALYKIAFNENQHVNNVPLVAVIVGTIFGVGLVSLALSVFFIKNQEPSRTSMLVVLSIGTYLLVNCVIYFIYVVMFKKRPVDLRKFIK